MIRHLCACDSAAACDRFGRVSMDANRSVDCAAGFRKDQGDPRGETERRTPFVSRRLCATDDMSNDPSLRSPNINKEPTTQRARSKYNVLRNLASLFPSASFTPRFTTFLILHDPPGYRASSFFYEESFLPIFLFHFLALPPYSNFLLFILCTASLSLFPFLSFSPFGQLLCIVRTRAFGEILIPLCQLHSRTSRA